MSVNILIIANARRKGGLSGGDNIYENFARYWKGDITVKTDLECDFRPFVACYLWRVIKSLVWAFKCDTRYDLIYSASDFLMDMLPAWVLKARIGGRWVAAFYLFAPRRNIPYRISQLLAKAIIMRYADIVCITNDTMKSAFKGKKTVSVNGGVDIELTKYDPTKLRKFDAVFCGRIHPTKGIAELIDIWEKVTDSLPTARLALIGDGDLGLNYVKQLMIAKRHMDITLFGFMGEERFDVFKDAKCVLYTTPKEHDHFSMSPVEAMACGCPLICFDTTVINAIDPKGTYKSPNINDFARHVKFVIKGYDTHKGFYDIISEKAREWATTWDWETNAANVWDKIK